MREMKSSRLEVSLSRPPGALTIHVRGKLIYPWTRTLRNRWQESTFVSNGVRKTLDLSGVRQIDADGADLLREMMRSGFRMVTRDPALQDLVESMETQIREANFLLEYEVRPQWPLLRAMSR
jgi:ABC-type transporter Mla MlaB component